MRRLALALGTAIIAAGSPPPGGAQVTDSITVRVRQVAGADFYVDAGTRRGLASGDTLAVAGAPGRPAPGSVVVVAATEDRAAL
ncbi:MAG TPA: hypothetical protein VLL48_07120, partial [Longimicrobiales bacterium]|nr:hypothetical protein [Longimicrobiales bacterium]